MAHARGIGVMFEQHQRIFTPFAQRRDAQRGHVQSVIQVCPEAALIGRVTQIFLGRGDDADVQRDLLIAAHSLDHAFLQQAQQLDLHVQAHAFDFIEEQRAAVGKLELADTPLLRAGKGPWLVAEQLAFHHRFSQRAGVDRHERAAAAVGQIVQRAGDHFFACAGFAEDQHVGSRPGQCADLFAQTQDRRRLTDQACAQLLAITQGQAQAAVIQHQTAQRQSAAHAVEHGVAGEGLFQKVVGPGAHGLYRQRYIAMPGDQQHRQVGVLRVKLVEQFQAVHALHANIADHHARPVAADAFGQPGRFGQRQNVQASQVQRLAQGLTQVRIVVDQHHLNLAVDGCVRTHAERSSGG
ncbi:hypothetical protein ALP78_05388 [Pseudomonas coronafaciens pv. striafaciens]|uniref:Uncharacterized protein n=1 Tax=Pseudomonas coronafaciens pv. striafaciens TaxID=235276 RepID=A0A3M4YSB0_9PSED|nr:hypothetical protein ALP78_05388 [Pseudomonas coronafaciens pv. striafaciens]